MKIVKAGFAILFLSILIGCCFFVKLHSVDENSPRYEDSGDGSLQVYFINLEKSVDRLAHIKPKVEALGYPYKRISAVYGKELSESYKASVSNPGQYKLLMHNEIGNGTIGCYLSHINTWREFLLSKHSFALVLEDDIDFEPSKLRTLVNLLLKQSTEWDYVNIDANRHGFAMPVKKLSRLYKLVKFRGRVGNTSCYLIGRKAAFEFIRRAFPICMPVDHFMMRPWEFGLKTRGVTPQIVHQSYGDSEIAGQETKNNVNFCYKITSLLYQISADLMTLFAAYFLH